MSNPNESTEVDASSTTGSESTETATLSTVGGESTETAASSTTTAEPTKLTRHVRFSAATKTNDGISLQNQWFDKLIEGLFVPYRNSFFTPIHNSSSLHAFLAKCPHNIVLKLHEQLRDLIDRVSQSGKAMLLPKGGGNAGKVDRSHLPLLLWTLHNFPLSAVVAHRTLSRAAGVQ